MRIKLGLTVFSVLIMSSAFLTAQVYLPSQTNIIGNDVGIGSNTPLGRLHILGAEALPSKSSGFTSVNYPYIVFQRSPFADLGDNSPEYWFISDDYGYLNFWKGKPGSGKELNLLALEEKQSVLYTGLDIQGGDVWTNQSWRKSLRIANLGVIQFDVSSNFKFGIGANDYDKNLCFFTSGTGENVSPDYKMILTNAGDLIIGAEESKGYKLAVAGRAVAEEVVVKLASRWPDYVFEKDYKLPSLYEVSETIKTEGRLPGMPLEEDVAANGLEMGQVTKLQQEKIEELYLHMIQMNEKLETLAEQNRMLKEQNELLSKRIENLERNGQTQK